jgi:transcriptional regulator with XRE-family HTH domain
MSFLQLISKKIRNEMRRQKITPKELAYKTGYTRHQIDNIVYMRATKVEVIKAVASALNIQVEEILARGVEKTTDQNTLKKRETKTEVKDEEVFDIDSLMKKLYTIQEVLKKEGRSLASSQVNIVTQCITTEEYDTLNENDRYFFVKGIINAVLFLNPK